MKKKIYLKMALGITLLVKKETLSDLVLSNVEALANSRENGDKTWTAPRTIACDYQQGPWHTASIERICEFCVTPNSCTPRACGM